MIVSRFPFSCRFPLAAGCKICKICHMLSFTFHICVMNFYSHGLVQLRELHPINVSKKNSHFFCQRTKPFDMGHLSVKYSTRKEPKLSLCVFNLHFRFRKKYTFCKYTNEMKTLIIIFGAKYTIIVLDNLHKAFLISRIYKAFERGKTSGRSFVIGQRNEGKRSFIDFLQHLYNSVFMKHPNRHTHTKAHHFN